MAPNSNLAIGQIYGPAWSHWLHRQVENCNTELILDSWCAQEEVGGGTAQADNPDHHHFYGLL